MSSPYDAAAYRKARPAYLAANPQCHYCGQPATTIDHALPVSSGHDPHDQTNWLPCCAWCNSSKRDRTAPSLRFLRGGRQSARRVSRLFTPSGQVGTDVGVWGADAGEG